VRECARMYIYTYIHGLLYIYIHTDSPKSALQLVCECVRERVCVRPCVCMFKHMYIYIHTCNTRIDIDSVKSGTLHFPILNRVVS